MPVGYNGTETIGRTTYNVWMDDAFIHDEPDEAPRCERCDDSLFDSVYYEDLKADEILCGKCVEKRHKRNKR